MHTLVKDTCISPITIAYRILELKLSARKQYYGLQKADRKNEIKLYHAKITMA